MKFFNNGMRTPCGEIHIVKDRCKGCGFCVTYCPMDVLEMSKEFNVKSYHFPEVKNIENCICCGLCEMLCPDFVIWSVVKEEKEVVEAVS